MLMPAEESFNKIIKLKNDVASINIDLNGGAIVSFIVQGCVINPLSFIFPKHQMPENNRPGANYQGHFACVGRWGAPSPGEMEAGLPHHGEPANMVWTLVHEQLAKVELQVTGVKEGLKVEKEIVMDDIQPIYYVEETVANINPLSRLYNIVQHPTLAAPFLDEHTLIDCNAAQGFDQANYKNIAAHIIHWPEAGDQKGQVINLRKATCSYNAVYSFIVQPGATHGWITAYSPTHRLLLGYVWNRNDYPWIHLWRHYSEGKIQYLGTEFGTAGIHQPFEEILATAVNLFGEPTMKFIDGGQSISRRFLSFTYVTPVGYSGVENIYIEEDNLYICGKTVGTDFTFKLAQPLCDDLPK